MFENPQFAMETGMVDDGSGSKKVSLVIHGSIRTNSGVEVCFYFSEHLLVRLSIDVNW
jgi:hypothetical protein